MENKKSRKMLKGAEARKTGSGKGTATAAKVGKSKENGPRRMRWRGWADWLCKRVFDGQR
jgi:hypothetical protein